MEAKIKHLELIQGVVNRLAANSFRMKQWAVVVVPAILVLMAREGRLDLAYIGLPPVLVFWWLDGYFLSQEQRYRDKYDAVRVLAESEVDFSMDVSDSDRRLRNAIASKTVVPVYVVLAATLIAVMFINR